MVFAPLLPKKASRSPSTSPRSTPSLSEAPRLCPLFRYRAGPVVDIDAIGLVECIGHEGVKVSIVIHVAQTHRVAIRVAQLLACIQIQICPRPDIGVHPVRFSAIGVGKEDIHVAVAVYVADIQSRTGGGVQGLAAVRIVPRAVVDVEPIRFAYPVGKQCVQVSVSVDVADAHAKTRVVAQGLTGITVASGVVVGIDPVWGGEVREQGIEIAVAVDIPDIHARAGGIPQGLAAVRIAPPIRHW